MATRFSSRARAASPGLRLAPLLVRKVAMGQEGHVEGARERPLHHGRMPFAIEHVEHLGLDRSGPPHPEIVPDGRQTHRVSARQDEARAPCRIEPRHLRGDGGGGAHDQHPAGAASAPIDPAPERGREPGIHVAGEPLPRREEGPEALAAHARILRGVDRTACPPNHRVESFQQLQRGGAAEREIHRECEPRPGKREQAGRPLRPEPLEHAERRRPRGRPLTRSRISRIASPPAVSGTTH